DITGVTLQGQFYNGSGIQWSTSGTGTFAPNAVDSNTRYTPSQEDVMAELVTLTLTATGHGTCNPAVTSMRVTITPLPVADAGEDQVICRGSNTTLLAKTFPDIDYAWYTSAGENISNSAVLYITA